MALEKYSNLFENYEEKKAPPKVLLVLSYGLRKLLERIIKRSENNLARDFLKLHKNASYTISFIDRSRDVGQISYTRSTKVIDAITDKGLEPMDSDIYLVKSGWVENREVAKVGRFINKLLKDKGYSAQDVETFVNYFKAESKKDTTGLDWQRVHGRDINQWYLADYYVKGGGTLNRSCLRKHDRNKFVNFLSNNPKSCRLLILKNDQNQLLGRALLWRLPDKRIYMDRIYTRFDEDVNLFLDSAKKLGWLYKSKQTYGGDVTLIDGSTGEEKWIKMEIPDFMKRNFGGYPYMDTFQFYDVKKNLLTNDESTFTADGSVVKLNRIDGGYSSYDDDADDDADMLD